MHPLTLRHLALSAALLVTGALVWSCAGPEAYLGDAPPSADGPVLTSDGAAEASGDAGPRQCLATECPAPYTTCPSEFGPTYKCAVDPRRDRKHCGACGHECITLAPIHMTSRCVEGACELECYSLPEYVFPDGERATSYQNCNGLLDDGCEVDLLSNRDHCGSCGNACAAGQRCFGGKCGCPTGLTDCDGTCVDLTTDDLSCSACGKACAPPKNACDPLPANAGYGCADSTCGRLKCDGHFADCNKDLALGCASNGCETSLLEPSNCGRCGKVCQADEQCSDDGFTVDCRPSCAKSGKTTCDGYCADIANDPDNCGGCGLFCPTSGPARQRACHKGVCVADCVDGFGDCNGDPTDGCETDLRVHPSHCGACGASCDLARGQPCMEGQCLVGPCDGPVTR